MISEHAHVSPSAIIGKNVTIKVGAVIYDNVIIDDGCYIGEYTTIGTPAEYTKKDAKQGKVRIGRDTTIREYVSIQSPVKTGHTSIGDNCYIMSHCHIAHDCHLGDNVNTAPGCTLGGGTILEDGVNMGLNSCTHPNLRVGCLAMVGLNSTITKDVESYKTVIGVNKVLGWNMNGMKKNLTEDEISSIIHSI